MVIIMCSNSRSYPLQVLVGGFRAAIRKGEDVPIIQRSSPQKAALINVPLFHVTGSTSYTVCCLLSQLAYPTNQMPNLDHGYHDWDESSYDEEVGS